MANWDTSFIRDGKGIADWLPLLVSEDADARHAAGEALGGMWQAKPAYNTRWDELGAPGSGIASVPDLAGQAGRFEQAVREAVEQPGFPRAAFVHRLILFRMALKRDWLDRVRRSTTLHDERFDAADTRLVEQMLTDPDPAKRRQAAERHRRIWAAAYARDQRLYDGAETMQSSGMLSYVVFGALGAPLLDAPDLLHEMLDDRDMRPYAVEALQRAGAAAGAFVDRLLRELDERGGEGALGFDGADVLGNVARADGPLARNLLGRLRDGNDIVRVGAATALAHAGPDALPPAVVDEAVLLLRQMVRSADFGRRPIPQLASLGRHRADVLVDLLDRAAPRPPRMRRTPGKYGVEYDEVMHERGMAIEGLRYFTAFPDRVVPALVDAIETFEEYDADWGYEAAEHGRVVTSLRAFSAAAAELGVPVLVRHLIQSDGGELDGEVVRLLGDFGPDARDALPALRKLLAEREGEHGPDEVVPDDPNLRRDDPLRWAVRRIES